MKGGRCVTSEKVVLNLELLNILYIYILNETVKGRTYCTYEVVKYYIN